MPFLLNIFSFIISAMLLPKTMQAQNIAEIDVTMLFSLNNPYKLITYFIFFWYLNKTNAKILFCIYDYRYFNIFNKLIFRSRNRLNTYFIATERYIHPFCFFKSTYLPKNFRVVKITHRVTFAFIYKYVILSFEQKSKLFEQNIKTGVNYDNSSQISVGTYST